MNWIFVGALCGALSVAAGAFGAHALAARLEPRELQDLWEVGRALPHVRRPGDGPGGPLWGPKGARRGVDAAGWCLLAGQRHLQRHRLRAGHGRPRWLGAVTPLGGTLLIAGFLIFAWAALRG